MDSIVIDTSAWIESFRPKGNAVLSRLVKESILKGAVLLPGIILAELLRGAKTTDEYDHLKDLLHGLSYLPVSDDLWDALSKFSFELFRKGVAVPLTDTYIAWVCIDNHVPILHWDKHFDLIAAHSKLKVVDYPKKKS